ncbi:hypothetical protein H5410_005882, partial [Solanum commersonii]
MPTNAETVVKPVDTPVDSMTRESATAEQNRTLRHVMAQLCKPGTMVKNHQRYVPFDNCGVGPSTTHPQGMPFRNNPTSMTVAPVYTFPQPTVMQRAAQEGQFTAHPEQYYTPGFQANERCEYHSGDLGLNTDNCCTLKGEIQKLIDHGVVIGTDDQNTPNVTNNPLLAQNNLVGMIYDDQDYKLLGKMGKLFKKIGEKDMSLKNSEPIASFSVEGVNLDTKVLCVPGVSKEIEVRVGMLKLYVSKGFSLAQQDQICLAKLKEPIFVKTVQQLSVINTKVVPWNYNKIILVYRGKEIVDEVDEAGGLTRSERCYSPEELRKGKMTQNIQVPLKKQKKYRLVLNKILNEAHVLKETM